MSNPENSSVSPLMEKLLLKSPNQIPTSQNTPNLHSVTRAFRFHCLRQEESSPLVFFRNLKSLSQVLEQTKPSLFLKSNFLNNITMDQQFVEKYFDFDSDSESFAGKPEPLTAKSSKFPQLVFLHEKSFLEAKVCNQFLLFNDLIKIDNQSSILEAMKLKKSYQCDLCDQSFASGCALGGHRSKVHSANGKKKYNKNQSLYSKSQEQQERANYLKDLKKNKIH